MSILGARVLRTEDPGFLTSGAVHTDDLSGERLAGACHLTFVRSPLAHARIRAVDVSGALSAPGVLAAFTGAGLTALPPLAPPLPGLVNDVRRKNLRPAGMATPTSYNPLGAKDIGEAGTIGATPAVQNAVVDALSHLGVRHIDMPATPQRVWQALHQASRERA